MHDSVFGPILAALLGEYVNVFNHQGPVKKHAQLIIQVIVHIFI